MKVITDLHSHSGYSGGVGQVSLEALTAGMQLKGIDIFGTGDCLHSNWHSYLKRELKEKKPGLFVSEFNKNKYFVLQTEIIFTIPYSNKKRKLFHIVLLFPDFNVLEKTVSYIESINVKNNIGRPFVKFNSIREVEIFIDKLKGISPLIEFIPAHVMTPQGIFGSKNPVYYLEALFGKRKDIINIVETGLSADPEMLSVIPELDNINFISCSDCHSPAISRIGRELTFVEIKNLSYASLIESLRDRKKTYTYEFPPEEGKFFLTGHRKGKQGHKNSPSIFYPQQTPETGICPDCNKNLTIGVYEHLIKIAREHNSSNRFKEIKEYKRKNFKKLVPLSDVVREAFKVKSYTSKVNRTVISLINYYGSEVKLWDSFKKENHPDLSNQVIEAVFKVKNQKFEFEPGYDGEYGKLKIH
ncbi:MAG: endonuclease Q family protein [Candidatus Muiribacteriota bacterium]